MSLRTTVFLQQLNSTSGSIKKLLFFLFFVLPLFTAAQFNVSFTLKLRPGQHADDSVFIAGNFNNWNPGDKAYLLSDGKGNLTIHTKLPEGIYEYKCTRGDWGRVEAAGSGLDIDNRLLKLNSDTSISIDIKQWKDDFPSAEKRRTMSANVSIMDASFNMPQLDRNRRIWIYLPKNYKTSSQHYPVLYMHDGQNLFDEFTAGFGEWGVDECLDSLIEKGKPACIVVGIDNGPKRMNEYNPFDHEKFGNGEGEAYVTFIAETLKPYIDKHYRTLKTKDNTIIAGSSMGGLISYYAMLKYPEVFGKGGIFSPAFWTAPGINNLTDSVGKNQKGKLFFYIGGLEGGTYVQDMKDIAEKMGKLSTALIYSVVDDNASHNEKAWRKWFPEFYQWIMAEGYGYFIPVEK